MKVHHPLLWQCLFALALSHVSLAVNEPRQIIGNPATGTSLTGTNTATTTGTTTATTATTTNSPPPNNTQITDTTTTTSDTTTAQPSTPTTPTTTTTNTSATQIQDTTSGVSVITTESAITTTNAAGDAVTITETQTLESTSSSAPSSTNTSNNNQSDGGKGLSTGSIVGMSVAAGVAVIGIVGFFVWKFTRKRFSDFDDNEAIKWPELNSHGGDNQPLPTRGGFETGSEADLSRVTSTSNYSTPDFGAGGPDPYAVPPLPHMNPNQPYRDDPASGYYDPYQGPLPGTLENGGNEWQPEAYPMTQLGGPPGRASPAPAADYVYEGGRPSPAPHGMYGGRASPGPQAAYGRASPVPQAGGYPAGRMSPGPHAAYGGR